jgi:protein CpxP
MNHPKRSLRQSVPAMLALAISGAVAFAVPAMAQTDAAPMSASPAPAMPAPANSMPSTMPAPHRTASSRVERQITQLHARLKITPAQAPQWEAVAQAMRDNAEALDTLYQQRSEQFHTLNAVDGLKSYEAIEQAHVDGLQHLVPVFAALYAAMTPAQQKNADAVFRYQAERQQHARAKRVQPKSALPPKGTGTHE